VPIGETLAKARQRAGLTVAQVSEQTRIKRAVIEGIEGGDYFGCGGDFYARANIRSIAGVVGADPGPLIAEYDALYRGRDALSAVSLAELLATSVPAVRRRWADLPAVGGLMASGYASVRRRAGSHVASGSAVPPYRPPGRWLIRVATLGLVAVLGFGVYSRLSGPGHVMAAPPSAGKHAVTHQQPGPGRPGPAPTITRSAVAPAPGPTITHAAMAPAPAPAITRAGVAAASATAAPAQTRTPASAGAPGPGGGSPPARDGIGGNPTPAPAHRLVHRHPRPKPALIRRSAPGQAPPSHRHGRRDHHRRRAPAVQQAVGRSGHNPRPEGHA
jgi:transcriptional regulator with XRE-family HTH domain